MESEATRWATWPFLTNHARVLVLVARQPALTVCEIAARCQITERSVHRIIGDLEEAGYLARTQAGRRSRYHVIPGQPLHQFADLGATVEDLLSLFVG